MNNTPSAFPVVRKQSRRHRVFQFSDHPHGPFALARLMPLYSGFFRTIPGGSTLAFGWYLCKCENHSCTIHTKGTCTPSGHASAGHTRDRPSRLETKWKPLSAAIKLKS